MASINNIIISRTDKIGDFVVSIPSYATAKAMYPSARIIALVSNANSAVAMHVKCIDEVISIDDYKDDDASLISKLRSFNPDVFIALVSNNHISSIASKSGAKVRIGPHSKLWSFIHYNRGFRQKRSECIKSEAEYNLDLIKHLDPELFDKVGIHFDRIAYTDEDGAKAKELIASLNIADKPFILINPFTGGSGSNLSEAHYSQVITGILSSYATKASKSNDLKADSQQDLNAHSCATCAQHNDSTLVPEIVVMGIKSQQERIERVIAAVPENLREHLHVCINEHSLMVAAALTDLSACFIGPSTGITQFAGNYRKPVICFYSSRISNSHTRWALYGDTNEHPVTFDRYKLHAETKELQELEESMALEIINTSLEQFYSSKEVALYQASHKQEKMSKSLDEVIKTSSEQESGDKHYEKLSLTVALIAHNEADRLPPTLAKIQDIASEIIVINSVSTDKTIDVAKSFGAKVYTEEFKGFVKQKNSLIPKCTQDWILFLDADEVLNDELKDAIVKVIKEDSHDAYEMNRLTFYLGKLLKHAWQPNYRLRLVRRDSNPRWEGELVHEALNTDSKVKRLPGYIIHYSYRDVNDHFLRTVRYAKMSAQSYIVKGKKPSLMKIIFSPIFSFIKLYFVKLGFMDGRAGYIAAQSAFIYTFLKYVFLWEASKGLDYKADTATATKTSNSNDTSAAYAATQEQVDELGKDSQDKSI